MDLTNLRALLALSRFESFSAAAKSLGIARSTLARRVGELEQAMGHRLVLSHADGATLTEHGRFLVAEAHAFLSSADSLEARVRGLTSGARGVVRCVVQAGFAPPLVAFGATTMASTHPELSFDIRFSEEPARTLVDWGEIAIQIRASAPEGPFNARTVARSPLGLYATQRYLDAHGTPTTVDELRAHPLYCWRPADEPGGALPLRAGGHCEVSPQMTSPDLFLMHLAAQRGSGIAYGVRKSPWEDPATEPNVPVLEDVVGTEVSVWLLTRRGLSSTPAVRAFLDGVVEMTEALGFR